MPRPKPSEYLVRRNTRAGDVLANRIREEPMKTGTLFGVKVVNVARGDELDLGALREGARLIQDEATSTNSGAQRV
jgi:hypothetical protein